MSAIFNPSCACSPVCPPLTEAGPPGTPGVGGDGADGADGVSAYTTVTNSFVQPYPTVTYSAGITSGQPDVVVADTSALRAGMAVSGTGIPANTTILSVDNATDLTLSANATSTTTANLTFTDYVTIVVGNSTWIADESDIFIARGGYYVVKDIPSGTTLTIEYTGVGGDVVPNNSNLVPAGSKVAPAGPPGAPGDIGSVALAVPAIFSVAGSPLTADGTITLSLVSQLANLVFASPNGAPGTPSFRSLVAGDIPNLDAAKITTGQIPIARGGTGAGTAQAAINALVGFTTKGDVLAFTGTNAVRQGVGTEGQVLVARAASSTGIAWEESPQRRTIQRTSVSSFPYVVLATDFLVGVNHAAPVTVTLPASPVDTQVVCIKDEAGVAHSHTITIAANAGQNIEGAASTTITTAYGFKWFYYVSASNRWFLS